MASADSEAHAVYGPSAAHDLANYLSIIVTTAGFIRKEMDDPSAVDRDVQEIIKAANTALAIARQLDADQG
jgi:hypothetical protein